MFCCCCCELGHASVAKPAKAGDVTATAESHALQRELAALTVVAAADENRSLHEPLRDIPGYPIARFFYLHIRKQVFFPDLSQDIQG